MNQFNKRVRTANGNIFNINYSIDVNENDPDNPVDPVEPVVIPIANNLTTTDLNYALGASQGVVLKGITDLQGATITQLRDDVDDLINDVQSLGDQVTAMTVDIANILGEQTDQQNEINALTTRVTTAEGTIATHTSDINNINFELTGIGGTLSTMTGDIANLQFRMGQAETAIDDLDTLTNNHTAQLSTLNTTVSTHTGQISTLNTNVGTNTTNIASNTSAISGLNTTVGTHTGQISTLNTNVGALQTHTAQLQIDVNNLTTADEDLQTEIDGLTAVVNSHTTTLGTLSTTSATHTSQIASLNSSISALSGQRTYMFKILVNKVSGTYNTTYTGNWTALGVTGGVFISDNTATFMTFTYPGYDMTNDIISAFCCDAGTIDGTVGSQVAVIQGTSVSLTLKNRSFQTVQAGTILTSTSGYLEYAVFVQKGF